MRPRTCHDCLLPIIGADGRQDDKGRDFHQSCLESIERARLANAPRCGECGNPASASDPTRCDACRTQVGSLL